MGSQFHRGARAFRAFDRAQGAMDEVQSSIAHDFRNHLQLATSTLRIVRREIARRNEAELAAALDQSLGALERAGQLAVRLGSPDAGRSEPEEVRLQELVPEMRSMLRTAVGSDVQLQSLVAEGLPPLRCDRLQLENVIVNLVLNARDAMPLGGTVVLQAVSCVVPRDHPCIALSVTDTGCGMTEEVVARAFEPFFTTRSGEGGTGLGLHNVRVFAEAMGGRVEIATGEGVGTRVVLHLPLVEPGAFERLDPEWLNRA